MPSDQSSSNVICYRRGWLIKKNECLACLNLTTIQLAAADNSEVWQKTKTKKKKSDKRETDSPLSKRRKKNVDDFLLFSIGNVADGPSFHIIIVWSMSSSSINIDVVKIFLRFSFNWKISMCKSSEEKNAFLFTLKICWKGSCLSAWSMINEKLTHHLPFEKSLDNKDANAELC